jgi:hypothetical protein
MTRTLISSSYDVPSGLQVRHISDGIKVLFFKDLASHCSPLTMSDLNNPQTGPESTQQPPPAATPAGSKVEETAGTKVEGTAGPKVEEAAGTKKRTPEEDNALADQLSLIIEDANKRVVPICEMIRKVCVHRLTSKDCHTHQCGRF